MLGFSLAFEETLIVTRCPHYSVGKDWLYTTSRNSGAISCHGRYVRVGIWGHLLSQHVGEG